MKRHMRAKQSGDQERAARPAHAVLRQAALGEAIDLARRAWLRKAAATALLPLLAAPALSTLACFGEARADNSCDQSAATGGGVSFGDAWDKVGAVLAAGLDLVPEVGGVLSLLVEVLWPIVPEPGEPDVWAEIKDKVQALIDQDIDSLVQAQMQQAVTGAQSVVQGLLDLLHAYQAEPSVELAAAIQSSVFGAHQLFLQQAPAFQPSGWQNQVLPYFTMFANLHLVLVRDVVWFGARNGLVDGVVDYFRQQFDVIVNRYCAYVDQVLPSVFADYEQRYQNARATLDTVYCDAGNGIEGGSDFVRLAAGAWKARKKQVDIDTSYTLMVGDFRARWPTMLNERDGAAPALTREILLGPFGIPELRDIDLCPANHCIAPEYSAPQPYPDVALPAASPLAPITHVTGGHAAGFMQWPAPFGVVRANEPPPSSLLIDLGGRSIVGVKLWVGRYVWVDQGVGRSGAAGGHGIGRIEFTLDDQSTITAGNTDAHDPPHAGMHQLDYAEADPNIAPGHRLSQIHVASRLTTLYDKASRGDDHSETTGSVIFGARLIDPDTSLQASMIATLYASSLRPISVDAAVDIVVRSHANRGRPFAADEVARLRADARATAVNKRWDVRRSTFLQRLHDSRGS